jgi:hypothetical protein
MVMEVMAMEDMDMAMEDMDMAMEDMDMAMEDMDMVMVMEDMAMVMVMEDMDTAMATLIGTMVTGTTGMGTVMADGGAATGMATVSVHAGAGHPADTSGFATSRDLLISGNSGRRFRTGVLLFQGGSGVA